MPAFYRRHESVLAQPMLPQSEQVWVGLSLTPQSVTAFCNGPLRVTTAWPPARRHQACARSSSPTTMPCPPVTTVNHSITAGETHVQTSFTNFTGTPRAPSSFRGCVRRAIAAFAQFVPHCLLSRRAKCSTKIRRLVHDQRNDPACRRDGHRRIGHRRHAHR